MLGDVRLLLLLPVLKSLTILRARYPSSQSVSDATRNSPVTHALDAGSCQNQAAQQDNKSSIESSAQVSAKVHGREVHSRRLRGRSCLCY